MPTGLTSEEHVPVMAIAPWLRGDNEKRIMHHVMRLLQLEDCGRVLLHFRPVERNQHFEWFCKEVAGHGLRVGPDPAATLQKVPKPPLHRICDGTESLSDVALCNWRLVFQKGWLHLGEERKPTHFLHHDLRDREILGKDRHRTQKSLKFQTLRKI